VKIDAVKRRSKGSKRFELLIKTTEVIMFNQTKVKKTKRKSPNPTLGVREQAQVILSLKIP
jgi:hypothetical protein